MDMNLESNKKSSRHRKRGAKNGFTLIELLVVIAIIGLLSSTVLASLNTARAKARDARRISDMKQLQLAIELFFDDFGYYPRQNADSANGIVGEGAGIDTMLSGYISAVPNDPSGPGASPFNYYYDGTHTCANVVPDNRAVLFSRTMENPDLANWTEVCNGPGGEGSPNVNSYMIVFGPNSG